MHLRSSRQLHIFLLFNIPDTHAFPGKIDGPEMRIELTLIKCSDKLCEPMTPMTVPKLKDV